MVHYINSSPVFIQVRRNRGRRPALGGSCPRTAGDLYWYVSTDGSARACGV